MLSCEFLKRVDSIDGRRCSLLTGQPSITLSFVLVCVPNSRSCRIDVLFVNCSEKCRTWTNRFFTWRKFITECTRRNWKYSRAWRRGSNWSDDCDVNTALRCGYTKRKTVFVTVSLFGALRVSRHCYCC